MGYFDQLSGVVFNANSDFQFIQRDSEDVFEQAEALPYWWQDYTQLSKGAFAGSVKSLSFNGIQLFSEKMNRAVDQIASAPQGCFVIGLPTIVEGESTWGHLSIKQHSLLTLNKNSELYFRTSANSEIVAAVIPFNRLIQYAIQTECWDFEYAIQSIKPVEALHPEVYARLLNTLMQGLQIIPEIVGGIDFYDQLANFEEDLLAAIMHALIEASKNPHQHYSDYKIARYIVNRVRNFTLSSDGNPLSIEEICERLRIKRRTLNHAFVRALGVSPVTYMRNLKLQKIRKELKSHADITTSISYVASKWGFVHMSLFSKYYREMYGENPTDTLYRQKFGECPKESLQRQLTTTY